MYPREISKEWKKYRAWDHLVPENYWVERERMKEGTAGNK
jgi:hypothetical protein